MVMPVVEYIYIYMRTYCEGALVFDINVFHNHPLYEAEMQKYGDTYYKGNTISRSFYLLSGYSYIGNIKCSYGSTQQSLPPTHLTNIVLSFQTFAVELVVSKRSYMASSVFVVAKNVSAHSNPGILML